MAEKKLFDNLYKVIKCNSDAIAANDTVVTEILDLQIPRGYCARIRKIIFSARTLKDQTPANFHFTMLSALVLDPDDETHASIPTFEVDHDVLADARFEMWGDITTTGESSLWTPRWEINFDETLDIVTVRNVRFNTIVNGMIVNGDNKPQTEVEVYFTYEKISADLYAKLLGIS